MKKQYSPLSEESRKYLRERIGMDIDYSRYSIERLRQLYKEAYAKVVKSQGELYGKKIPIKRDTLIGRIQNCKMINLLNDLSPGEPEHGK